MSASMLCLTIYNQMGYVFLGQFISMAPSPYVWHISVGMNPTFYMNLGNPSNVCISSSRKWNLCLDAMHITKNCVLIGGQVAPLH